MKIEIEQIITDHLDRNLSLGEAVTKILRLFNVSGWFLGAVAWRTCGRDCAASGMGATTQRKKLDANEKEYNQ